MRSRDGDAVLGRGGHDERLPKRRGTHNADREERRDEQRREVHQDWVSVHHACQRLER